jgi:SulP family sulfate permease
MAVLASILVVVAYHMSEWREFRAELSSPRSDVIVLLATFLLTVLVDLTVAIEVGMVLAAFLFIRRMAEVTNVSAVTRELEDADEDVEEPRRIPKGVEVYEINGAFFFGAAERFKDTLARVAKKPKVLIIRMRHVLVLDSTGMHALKDVVHRSRKDGSHVLLADVHMQPLVVLTGSTVLEEIGQENLFPSLDDALAHARTLVDSPGRSR